MCAARVRSRRRYIDEMQAWLKEETGYQAIQGTRLAGEISAFFRGLDF
jgi:hypothetical protein